MKLFLSLFAFLLISIGVQAADIYSQPAAAGSSGYLSSTYSSGGSNLEEFVWDSFSTPTTQTLREIQWRGTRSGPAPVDFQISINTIALPGGTVWHTNGAASETATATPGVYDYKFTLPAGFVLTGGQGYWLQIIGLVDSYFPYWKWSASTIGNGLHIAQVPAVTGDYRFINGAGDVAFTLLNQATVPVTIAVNALPSAGGNVTGGGTYAPGVNVTVMATPAVGRTFLNWTEAGVIVSASASYSFAADGHKTLSAHFSGPNTGPYVINATANPSISGNVGGTGTFNAGEIVTLDSSAQDGSQLVSWTENGVVVSTAATYSFTATADRNLQANFTDPASTYFIYGTVATVNTGTIAMNGSAGVSTGTFNGGTIITINATAYPGYHFVNWKQGADVGGAQRIVGTSPGLTHVVVYATSLTATFEPNNPVLTLVVAPAASGTVFGAGTYASGASVTVNATPAVGYVFANWKKGAVVVSTSPSYTSTLTTHTTLTATFVVTNRTISATSLPTQGGSVIGAGVFGNGATVTLSATAAPGYYFSHWMLGGVTAGTTRTISFDALRDYAFVANFLKIPALTMIYSTTPGQIQLDWPSASTGWVLQESTNLVTWTNSTRAITTGGGQNIVTLTPAGAGVFFRLALP